MRRPIFYGWIIVAVTALVLLATAGVRAAPGAFLAGVVRESVGDNAAAFVAAGWIAIIAGFAALAIRRREPSIEPVPAAAA
jgi:hypothetical protein